MAPMCAATITWSRPAPASRGGPIARWGKAMGCGCKGGLHEHPLSWSAPTVASKLACAGVRSAPNKSRRLLRSQREQAPSPQQARSYNRRWGRMNYAELHCLSNFSFQRGASSALELFERAKRQGYSALAITDECTLAGIVRAWQAAKAVDLPLIIGSEMHIENGPKLVLLVESLSGYQHLCRLITLARRRAEKGRYRLLQEDFEQPLPGLLALWVAQDSDTQASLDWLRRTFDQ